MLESGSSDENFEEDEMEEDGEEDGGFEENISEDFKEKVSSILCHFCFSFVPFDFFFGIVETSNQDARRERRFIMHQVYNYSLTLVLQPKQT